jgi:haloacetate dehalogenase
MATDARVTPNSEPLFPGFDERTIAGAGADIHVRIAGAGLPLALLHGFPQSSVMWGHIAPELAKRFSVVAPDLRGYGRSAAPESHGGEAYSKRAMGADIVAVMRALGHEQFALAGHDRGARVAYRLALDHPEVVTRIAVLDIVPTGEMWSGMDAARAMGVYHWMFLAQPEPLPEMMIEPVARRYIDLKLASWTAARSLACFDPTALNAYRGAFAEPRRIHAMCEDYRAGATIDRALDDADLAAGRRIEAPLLALWGDHGIPAAGSSPLDVWRRWAHDARGHAIDCGHFLPEEAPEPTLRALLEFFS